LKSFKETESFAVGTDKGLIQIYKVPL